MTFRPIGGRLMIYISKQGVSIKLYKVSVFQLPIILYYDKEFSQEEFEFCSILISWSISNTILKTLPNLEIKQDIIIFDRYLY